jgi:hypothetical protein
MKGSMSIKKIGDLGVLNVLLFSSNVSEWKKEKIVRDFRGNSMRFSDILTGSTAKQYE